MELILKEFSCGFFNPSGVRKYGTFQDAVESDGGES